MPILPYLLALLPVVLYLVTLAALDSFSLVKWRTVVFCTLGGIAAALVAWVLFRFIPVPENGVVSTVIVPLVEECLKAVPIIVLVSRKKVAFFIDSVICGAATGGGFALLENILYVAGNPEMGAGTALFRGMSVALMHMGCTALVTVGLMLITREKEQKHAFWPFIIAMVLPVALHVLHNLYLLQPILQMIVVIVVMGGSFLMLFDWDDKLIHKWMDESINTDVQLLGSIHRGELRTTKAGQYLETVKAHFDPEVFFDMICFVTLFLELTIQAKSRLIMREADMDIPPSPEEITKNKAAYEELGALHSHIGSTAEITLKPIAHLDRSSRRAIESMLLE